MKLSDNTKKHPFVRDMFPGTEIVPENFWKSILDGTLFEGKSDEWYQDIESFRENNVDDFKVTTVAITLNKFYEIEWEHNSTPGELLDWINQLLGKSWLTALMLQRFIKASKVVNHFEDSDDIMEIVNKCEATLYRTTDYTGDQPQFHYLAENLRRWVREAPGVPMPWAS